MGESFTLQTAESTTSTIFFSLEFCSTEPTLNWRTVSIPANISIVLGNDGNQAILPTTLSSSAGISSDGACFFVEAETIPLMETIQLDKLGVFMFPSTFPQPETEPKLSTVTYESTGHNMIVLKSIFRDSDSAVEGSLVTIEDITPPKFLGCPSVLRVLTGRDTVRSVTFLNKL